jgi:hypothetical protein
LWRPFYLEATSLELRVAYYAGTNVPCCFWLKLLIFFAILFSYSIYTASIHHPYTIHTLSTPYSCRRPFHRLLISCLMLLLLTSFIYPSSTFLRPHFYRSITFLLLFSCLSSTRPRQLVYLPSRLFYTSASHSIKTNVRCAYLLSKGACPLLALMPHLLLFIISL